MTLLNDIANAKLRALGARLARRCRYTGRRDRLNDNEFAEFVDILAVHGAHLDVADHDAAIDEAELQVSLGYERAV